LSKKRRKDQVEVIFSKCTEGGEEREAGIGERGEKSWERVVGKKGEVQGTERGMTSGKGHY